MSVYVVKDSDGKVLKVLSLQVECKEYIKSINEQKCYEKFIDLAIDEKNIDFINVLKTDRMIKTVIGLRYQNTISSVCKCKENECVCGGCVITAIDV